MPDSTIKHIPEDCIAVLRHVWDYLDGRLTAEAAESLRAHMDKCPPCHDYQLFQESYFAAMERLKARQSAPWHVRAKVLAALSKAS
jgi:anti-sigma factor (TIGR02949 family)